MAAEKSKELIEYYGLSRKKGDKRQMALVAYLEDRVLMQKSAYNDMYQWYNMCNFYGLDTQEGTKLPWKSSREKLLGEYGYTEKEILSALGSMKTKESLSLKNEIERHNKQKKSIKKTSKKSTTMPKKKKTKPTKASAVTKRAVKIYDEQKETYQKMLKTKVRQGKKVTTAAKEASSVYKQMYGSTPTARWKRALREAKHS